MRTRMFKALTGSNTNPHLCEKVATYDDHGKMIDCAVVHCTKDGHKYYLVHNPNESHGGYLNDISLAMDMVKSGRGDCVVLEEFLGFYLIEVISYIDRIKGDIERNKFLEEWKDVTFMYIISYMDHENNSMNRAICRDNSIFGVTHTSDDLLTFETKTDAESYVECVKNSSLEYYNEYIGRTSENICDKEDIDEIQRNVLKKIQTNHISRFPIHWFIFKELLENDGDMSRIDSLIIRKVPNLDIKGGLTVIDD